MVSKRLSLIFAGLFALMMLASFASAGMNLYPEQYEANVSHGNSDSFEIKIENTYENWSLFNFTIGNTSSLDNFDLNWENPGSVDTKTNKSINIEISVPKQTSQGIYVEKLMINPMKRNISNESDTSGHPGPKELEITVNVAEDKDLSIESSDFDNEKTTEITIKNKGNIDLTGINLTSSGDFEINFSENDFDLDAGDTKDISLNILDDIDDLELGKNTITVKANSSQGISSEDEIIYEKSFLGDTSNIEDDLDLSDFELILEEGLGEEDDNEFYPLDKIVAEFNIENNGDWDVEDMELEACLFDVTEKECIADEGDMELSENDFDLDEDEDKDLTVTFEIDPDNLDTGNEDFRLYIKGEGEIDNADNEDLDGEKTGVSEYKDLSILQDEFVVVNDLKTSLEEDIYECGSEIIVKGKLWNIGEANIDRDEVYLGIYNKDLGIGKVMDIEDLDSLDYVSFETTLDIPEKIEEKEYYVEFIVYDDEDVSDNDVYELDNEDEDQAIYNFPLMVQGSCNELKADISETSLNSGEFAGDTFSIKTKISNTGEEETEYSLTASEYSDWASSVQFSEQVITLESGESKEVEISLDSKEGISGDKTFNMEVYADNELIKKQPIQVPVKENKNFLNLRNLNLVNILSIAIGIILIAIIIVLMVKLSKRRKKE